MSPKFANKFAGHHPEDDPRSLLFAAAGCTFPTTPPFRYRAQSSNALFRFAELNGDGLLLELFTPEPNWNNASWLWTSTGGDLDFVAIVKQQTPATRPGAEWICLMKIAIEPIVMRKTIVRSLGKCNVDILIGEMDTGDLDQGTTGTTFTIKQVEFDEELPP